MFKPFLLTSISFVTFATQHLKNSSFRLCLMGVNQKARHGSSHCPAPWKMLPQPSAWDLMLPEVSRPQHSAGVNVLPIKTPCVVEMRSTGLELHVSHSPNTHMPITAIFHSYWWVRVFPTRTPILIMQLHRRARSSSLLCTHYRGHLHVIALIFITHISFCWTCHILPVA